MESFLLNVLQTINFAVTPVELCTICGATIGVRTGSYGVCARCYGDIACEITPIRFNVEELPCIVAAEYGGVCKRAIEAVKINGNIRVLRLLGALMIRPLFPVLLRDTDGGDYRETPVDAVIPIPASHRGRRSRGFDQASELATVLPVPTWRAIARRGGTQQKKLSREERAYNALRYVPRRVQPHTSDAKTRVLILDDIVTTGASVIRGARILEGLGMVPVAAIACMIKR